jgi:hypothetical protein
MNYEITTLIEDRQWLTNVIFGALLVAGVLLYLIALAAEKRGRKLRAAQKEREFSMPPQEHLASNGRGVR